jgi:hypothetical protein
VRCQVPWAQDFPRERKTGSPKAKGIGCVEYGLCDQVYMCMVRGCTPGPNGIGCNLSLFSTHRSRPMHVTNSARAIQNPVCVAKELPGSGWVLDAGSQHPEHCEDEPKLDIPDHESQYESHAHLGPPHTCSQSTSTHPKHPVRTADKDNHYTIVLDTMLPQQAACVMPLASAGSIGHCASCQDHDPPFEKHLCQAFYHTAGRQHRRGEIIRPLSTASVDVTFTHHTLSEQQV